MGGKCKKILVLVLCLAVIFTGCKDKNSKEMQQTETASKENVSTSESETSENDSENIHDETTFNVDTDELPYTQEEIYAQMFDINNKIEIEIDISDEELLKMQKDYEEYSSRGSKSPIYREADVYITITTSNDSYTYYMEEAGVRMKGNTSRTSFYSEEEGITDLIHFKLDFQETFDDENYYGSSVKDWSLDPDSRDARKNRTFATLEKIDIKWNRNDDTTYIREYYAYETYRANGVLAPHTNIASVDVAGEHQGVFTLYEPIDKIFIEKYVAKEDWGGDLYKCGWTGNGASFTKDCSIGIEDEDNGAFYNYDLKTNKKTTDNAQLINLISMLNSGNVSKDNLAEAVDIENFLKFEAVSYFIGNPDDLRNNYNNYYIYFLKSSGKVIFIPYDLDRCFGVTKGWNPTGSGMSEVSPFSKNAEGACSKQINPLYIYTVDEGGYYVKEFGEVLKTVAQSEWLTEENFNKFYSIAYNNYKNDATPYRQFNNAQGYSFTFSNRSNGSLNSSDGNATFKEYIDAKMKSYNKYISLTDEYSLTTTVQSYYIRGSFTGWNVDDGYEMSYDSDAKKYYYNLTLSERSEFKVNNGIDGHAGDWYGYDHVASYSEGINVKSGDSGNISLAKGTYLITFEPESKTVTIEVQ